MPTFETNLSLDQLNSLIKTLGISIANLYGKTVRTNPDSPAGKQAWDDLSDNLRSLASLATQMANIMSES
jgi:hypothetical protein